MENRIMVQHHCVIRMAAAAMAVTAALGMSACAKRGEVRESVAQSLAAEETPDLEVHDDIVLDFDEAQSSAEELIEDEEIYVLNDYIDTYVDEERRIVNLIWVLQDDATEEDAVQYGKFLIKAFNDACAQQDFSIRSGDSTSYGGLYDNYRINLQVFRGKDMLLPENYLVSMMIPEATHEEIVPFSKWNGVAEVMMTEEPVWVPGGDYTGDFSAYEESEKAEWESAEAVRKSKSAKETGEKAPN